MKRFHWTSPFLVDLEEGKVLFYPWLPFLLFGASRAYVVSSQATHDSIARFVKRFQIISVVVMIVVLFVGMVYDVARIALLLAGLVSVLIHVVAMRPYLANLQQLSARDSCCFLARSWGAQRLGQLVVMSVMLIIISGWFGASEPILLAFCFFCLVHGLIAAYLLRFTND